MKGLLLHELVDGLRELIMEKRYLRKQIASKMVDAILPNVLKELNQVSNNLRVVKVARSDDDCAEVTLVDANNNTRRRTVDLKNQLLLQSLAGNWKAMSSCTCLDLV